MSLNFSLETEFSLSGSVNALAFSPCGRHLAAAVDDEVNIWDTSTWDLHCRYGGPSARILSLAWDEGNRLFAGCESGHLSMISFDETVYRVQGFQPTEKRIYFISVTADARYLALGGDDEVTIWELAVGDGIGVKWVFIRKLCHPKDKFDKAAVDVTGIAWVNESTRNLVVSYEKQGVVTWDTETGFVLFSVPPVYETDSSAPRVVIDGGPYYAVSYKTQIRVSKRQNGSAYRCFNPLSAIPPKAPIVWAQRGIWIIAALKDGIMLIHVEKRLQRIIGIENCPHVTQDVTHVAWNKSKNDGRESLCQLALVTSGYNLQIVRADLPLAPEASESQCQQERCGHYPLMSIYIFVILVGIVLYVYTHNLILT